MTSPPLKRVRSDYLSALQQWSNGPIVSQKAGSDGVPASSQHVTPLSFWVRPRTTLDIETPVKTSTETRALHNCTTSSSGPVPML